MLAPGNDVDNDGEPKISGFMCSLISTFSNFGINAMGKPLALSQLTVEHVNPIIARSIDNVSSNNPEQKKTELPSVMSRPCFPQ